MHHSGDNPFKDAAKLKELYPLAAVLAERFEKVGQPIGPTGKHPDGVLTPCDEGEIAFSVAHTKGKVVIQFNTDVQWIGMTPEQAIDLANGLKKHARKAQQ